MLKSTVSVRLKACSGISSGIPAFFGQKMAFFLPFSNPELPVPNPFPIYSIVLGTGIRLSVPFGSALRASFPRERLLSSEPGMGVEYGVHAIFDEDSIIHRS